VSFTLKAIISPYIYSVKTQMISYIIFSTYDYLADGKSLNRPFSEVRKMPLQLRVVFSQNENCWK